jgi:glycosyltransferase involved in cell wall biosynthesis
VAGALPPSPASPRQRPISAPIAQDKGSRAGGIGRRAGRLAAPGARGSAGRGKARAMDRKAGRAGAPALEDQDRKDRTDPMLELPTAPPADAPGEPSATPEAPDRPLKIALFSGNYNCVLDGANKALNRLVQHLLDRGHHVRVYSPTVKEPAFAPAGDLVSVPSLPVPLRSEYRLSTGLPARVEADIRAFAPDLFHLSAPDLLCVRAEALARRMGRPVVASLHTRFETYFDYYGVGFMRAAVERWLRRFYSRADLVLVPSHDMGRDLAAMGVGTEMRLWSRGVDAGQFSPEFRDMAWRRAQGFADDEAVLLFFGRLVAEKGLDMFEAAVALLRAGGHRVRPLLVGEGPARSALQARLGDAVFTGHLDGRALSRAVASADILLNPSVTEAFGNVTLEAMASGLVVVAADVTATRALLTHEVDGLIVPPRDAGGYAAAVARLRDSPATRQALGEAARARALGFQWPAILDAVIDAYRAAVAREPVA